MSARRPPRARCAPPWSGTPCGGVAGRRRAAYDGERCPRSSTSAAAPAASRSRWPSSVTGSWSSTPAPTPWPPSTGAPPKRGRHRPGHRRPGRPGRPVVDLASGADAADLVLCHGVLEVVDDPAAALATIAGVLRPGGTLSLLVAQRHAAVIARAMAGHFQQARALLDPDDRAGRRRPRRPPLHPRGAHRPGRRPPGWRSGRPRRPGLRRPGARLPARPRARRHPGAGRAGAGRGRAARVPPPRHPAAPARAPLTPAAGTARPAMS